ncbi:MAG: ABC transporter permease [Anaerolineae bacterium]|nr:ABC transporter permease [Anaerolineae bacterium]
MFLARRNLFHDKTRLALSVAGLALALMLMLVLNGIQSGLVRQQSMYYDNTPGAIVVGQEGAVGSSPMPRGTTNLARQTAGVASVIPILSQYFYLELHDRIVAVLVIGYEPQIGGGPWRLIEGREPEQGTEVVLDRVLAQRHEISVGDDIGVMGIKFKVVGLSEGNSSLFWSYVFVLKSTIQSLLFQLEITTLLFVTPSDGVSPAAVRDRLSDLPGADAMLKSDFTVSVQRTYDRLFGAPIRLMATIAFLVGALVVGLVIYTASIEREREYGVLKAIGARNRMLYNVVVFQALIAAGAGAIVGIGLALGVSQLIMTLRPEILISLEPSSALWALVTGLIVALLAAFFPARMVARLAPAEVFRR